MGEKRIRRVNRRLTSGIGAATFSSMRSDHYFGKKFGSFAEAEAWDDQEYSAMSPESRLDLVFELVEMAVEFFPHAFETYEPEMDPRIPRIRRLAP